MPVPCSHAYIQAQSNEPLWEGHAAWLVYHPSGRAKRCSYYNTTQQDHRNPSWSGQGHVLHHKLLKWLTPRLPHWHWAILIRSHMHDEGKIDHSRASISAL